MSPNNNPIDLRKIYGDCQHPNEEIELWLKGIEKLFPPYVELDALNRTVAVRGDNCYFALISFHKDTHDLALKQLCKCLTLVDSSQHQVVYSRQCLPYGIQLQKKVSTSPINAIPFGIYS